MRIAPKKGTIAPNMSANKHEAISQALFGSTRRAVLALIYGRPEESFYLRQIARQVAAGQGAVQRELARLVAAGLVLRTRKGREVYYQANPSCPVFAELKGLIAKTAGLAEVLQSALEPLADKITVAFVYGSFAKGRGGAGSDVDVMVIGQASFAEVCEALRPAQEKLGREVNPAVYPEPELQAKLAAGHHFLRATLAEEKIFLIGDEGELGRLAEKRLAG